MISRSILFIPRKGSDERRKSQNSQFMFNDSPVAGYGITWKNLVHPDRSHDNTIRRMRFACRITKATDIHTEYLILTAFPLQQWLRERA